MLPQTVQSTGFLDGLHVEDGGVLGAEELRDGVMGKVLEGILILRGGTFFQGENFLGLGREARGLGLLMGLVSEDGTGGQPNVAEGELEGVVVGWAR